ncbi:MAG: hypothetical protein ACYC9R_12140, partial [Nitrosotalea sp.]
SFLASDPFGDNASFPNHILTLDGSDLEVVYGSNGGQFGLFVPSGVGQTPYKPVGNAPAITYTLTFGCMERFAVAIKMPPAASDSLSGNYPSNDLSGMQAINKVRLKVLVYYSNDDTTYSGM